LEREVSGKKDAGDGHVDAGALDPEVRPGRQPGLGNVVEGRRRGQRVQQDSEVATQSDVRGEAQRGAEPELARETAIADQERPAEGKGRQALTKRQRRRWYIDRHHTLAVGKRLLLEAEGTRQP